MGTLCDDEYTILHKPTTMTMDDTWLATYLRNVIHSPTGVSFSTLRDELVSNVSITTLRKTCAPTKVIQSGVIGWYDSWTGTQRNKLARRGATHIPPIRACMFNLHYPTTTRHVYDILKQVNRLFKQVYPDQYRWQHRTVKQSGFGICNSAFTTITVNVDTHLLSHRDDNNLTGGICAIVTLGRWTGCNIILPEYNTGFNVQQGDVLFFDNSQLHCTSPIHSGSRVSLVFYAREGVVKKGSRTSPSAVNTFMKTWVA